MSFQGSLSDDERSVHYSSSGYYESPVDDDDDGGLSEYSSLLLDKYVITLEIIRRMFYYSL